METDQQNRWTKDTARKGASESECHQVWNIFSKVIVLEGESRAEYNRLLARLREARQPQGADEELEVEKMATMIWRQRRGLLAEGAEIRKNMEFVESDQRDREHEEAERIGSRTTLFDLHGLIRKIRNPEILEYCLESVNDLRKNIATRGFKHDEDDPILEAVYGRSEEFRLRGNLYDLYKIAFTIFEGFEGNRQHDSDRQQKRVRAEFLKEIDEEIRRLKREQEAHASIEATRTQLKILRQYVPKERALDRLLRYEAHLDRLYDRAASRLERLQRMRLGQPVLPELKVRHSLS
jgi:hypothetical protein